MKRMCLLLCAALAAPQIVSAQTARNLPAAAAVDAPVSPLQYRSVFANAFTRGEPKQAPDKHWTQANRIVAGDAAAAPQPTAAPQAQPARARPAGIPSGHHTHQKGH